MRTPVLDLRAAKRELKDSIDDFTGSLADGETTTREQAAALDGVAESSFDLLAAMAENGASADQLREKTIRLRDRLVDTAMQFGMSEQAARRYARQIGLIPREVRTDVSFNYSQQGPTPGSPQWYRQQSATPSRGGGGGGVTVNINGPVQAQDYQDFMGQMERRSRRAGIGVAQ